MEKLYNYLQKIGATERPKHGHYTPAPAEFYRETYGDNSYFTNAPNHTHPGAVVVLDYNADAPREYFQELKTIERKIETYCHRYGYTASRSNSYGVVYYMIEKTADREAADSFYYFRDAARHECEQYFHIAINNGTAQKEIEKTLRAIMDKYGRSYNEFLQSIGKETHSA